MPQTEQVVPGEVSCTDHTSVDTFLCSSLCCEVPLHDVRTTLAGLIHDAGQKNDHLLAGKSRRFAPMIVGMRNIAHAGL